MPNLLATTWGRRVAFFLLYVCEGIPFGFAATAVTTQMRQVGVDAAQIGVFTAWLYLPWAWKWVAGPVVDLVASDRLGRRRAWIAACQIAMAGTILLAWPIDFMTRAALFAWVIFVHNAFAAVQDVAIDALAVDVLPKDERGVASGVMFAGQYTGLAVGGSGVLYLSTLIDFNATFPFVAAAVLAIMFGVTLWLREPRRAEPAAEPGAAGRRVADELRAYVVTALGSMFGSRRSIAGVIFALLPAGAFGLNSVVRTTLGPDLGMSNDEIATLGLLTTVTAATGCIVGGLLSDKLGRRRSVAAYVLLTVVPTLAMAWWIYRYGWTAPPAAVAVGEGDPATRPAAPAGLVTAFWVAVAAFGFAQGLIYGGRTALFMDLSNPAVAATQFTAYMALMNLVISYTSWWQGYAIQSLGYPRTLLIDAAAGLVCLAVLPFMSAGPRDPDQAPGREPPTSAFEAATMRQ